MKLTKDDFENIGFREDMIDQILKNQELAKKYRDMNVQALYWRRMNNMKIVERLKKRIEELNYNEVSIISSKELQKILEG